ncbi:MAG: type II toxin-antitoxin system Phd/YefM family antitoxin [Geminicoccaceae bacterium]
MSVAQAKARLSELLDRVEQGEEIEDRYQAVNP